jgi:hypothetical protein
MLAVQSVSQLEEAVRKKVQCMLVIGELAADIKESCEVARDLNYAMLLNKMLQGLLSRYDVFDNQKQGHEKAVFLSRKIMTPYLRGKL